MGSQDYIQPDLIYAVPILDGELRLSASFDTIHHHAPLDAYVLKYFNPEGDEGLGRMCDVMLKQDGAEFLVASAGLSIVKRKFITMSEHDRLLDVQASSITDADFGL